MPAEAGPSWKNCCSLQYREVMAGFAEQPDCGKEDLRQGWGNQEPSCCPAPLGIACPPFPKQQLRRRLCLPKAYFWHRGAQLFDLRAEVCAGHHLLWLQPHLPPCSALYFPSYPAPGPLQLRTLGSKYFTSVFTIVPSFSHSNVCYQHCLQ